MRGMPLPIPPINFWGPAAREFLRLPPKAIEVATVALQLAEQGGKHLKAKPLRLPGVVGSKVMEIVINVAGDTYRVVYTPLINGEIWVLRAFQKKSTMGIKTSVAEIQLILSRYTALLRERGLL